MDDDGMPVSRMEYLPYGETWFQEGDENNAPKYNSQELDKETGYYFYNARHYDPEISRFVTPDTVIDGEFDTQGWNRYSYVKGNPIVYMDPTGHFKKESETVTNETATGVYKETTTSGGTVEKGDTLWAIAKDQLQNELGKGNVTNKHVQAKVAEIKDVNGLKNDLIKPGQKLQTGKSTKTTEAAGAEERFGESLAVGVVGAKVVTGMAVATKAVVASSPEIATATVAIGKEMAKNAKDIAVAVGTVAVSVGKQIYDKVQTVVNWAVTNPDKAVGAGKYVKGMVDPNPSNDPVEQAGAVTKEAVVEGAKYISEKVKD